MKRYNEDLGSSVQSQPNAYFVVKNAEGTFAIAAFVLLQCLVLSHGMVPLRILQATICLVTVVLPHATRRNCVRRGE
jgi:hypothetical protein